MRYAIVALLSVAGLCAQSALVSTLIGGGIPQYPFTAGIPGPNAAIYLAAGIAADSSGNVFVADFAAHRILRVDHATSATTVYAGTGSAGVDGDGGPATSAGLTRPLSVAVDAADNVYVFENQRIRRVDRATGIISTLAVTGYSTFFLQPTGKMAFDPAGNLVFALTSHRLDFSDSGVFRVDAKSGTIQRLVGGGTSASAEGASALSVVESCESVQVDSEGNIYFSSTNNHIWKLPVDSDRLVNLAGTGQFGNSGDGGPGTKATVFQPSDLALDSSGGLFFTSSTLLRRLDLKTGIVNAVQPKSGTTPYLGFFQYLAETPSGDLLVSDGAANRVWRYLPGTGALLPLAGNGQHAYIPDVLTDWSSFPSVISDMAIHPDGSLFIAADSRIYQANWQTGMLRRVAGTGLRTYSGDGGPALQATLGTPLRMSFDSAGDLLMEDGYHIRKIDGHTGTVTTVASNVGSVIIRLDDKSGWTGPAADAAGNVYFTTAVDDPFQVFRGDASTGKVTLYAGTGHTVNRRDGVPASAADLGMVTPWLVDPTGTLYFTDSWSDGTWLRKIDTRTGLLSTAGQVPLLTGLTRTGSGKFYYTASNEIGSFDESTKTVTIISRNSLGDSGDGGVASTAQFQNSSGLGLDPNGNLLVASNGRIRKLSLVSGSEPVFGPNNIINAASLKNGVSANCWASLSGDRLAAAAAVADSDPMTELAGTYLQIVDSTGAVFNPVLQLVAPNQIVFLVPADAAAGPAQISVVRQGVESPKQPLTIQPQAPGLFSADSTGARVAAGFAVYVSADGSQMAQPLYNLADGKIIFNPTVIPDSGSSVYLSLFGTGWINISADSVTVSVGGQEVPVVFIGAQGEFAGLDPINLGPFKGVQGEFAGLDHIDIGPLPLSLKENPGEVNIIFTIANAQVNVVQVGVF